MVLIDTAVVFLEGVEPNLKLNYLSLNNFHWTSQVDSFPYYKSFITKSSADSFLVTRPVFNTFQYSPEFISKQTIAGTITNQTQYTDLKANFVCINKLNQEPTYLLPDFDTIYRLNPNLSSIGKFAIPNFLTVGFTDQIAQDFISTNDGGLVQCGQLQNSIVHGIYILKTDALGTVIFRTPIIAKPDSCISIIEDTDGGLVSLQVGDKDSTLIPRMWIVKTDANGSYVGLPDYDLEALSIFPNPIQSGGILKFNYKATNQNATFSLHDLTGRVVFEKQLAAGSENHEIQLPLLQAGLYIVEIRSGNSKKSAKLVVE